jgi:hypothetical protein
VSVGLEYKSVDSAPSDKELEVSRKEMVAYFSTKKNRNVKESLVSSHTIPVCETTSTPFVGIGHPSKKIPNCLVFPHPPMVQTV